jgi:hypothetical protein
LDGRKTIAALPQMMPSRSLKNSIGKLPLCAFAAGRPMSRNADTQTAVKICRHFVTMFDL